jgi:outer membrane protein assembly factor BamE (lipoprotein component of BamABCDE complex)
MKKILLLSIIFLASCSLEKVVKHHGVHFLEKKQLEISIFKSNKNNVLKILGPPSSTSFIDQDLWFYIERKTTVSNLKKLGKSEILVNNVLALEFDNRGMLIKKNLYNKNDINKFKISKNETDIADRKDNILNTALQTLRKKINDPLGKRSIEN